MLFVVSWLLLSIGVIAVGLKAQNNLATGIGAVMLLILSMVSAW